MLVAQYSLLGRSKLVDYHAGEAESPEQIESHSFLVSPWLSVMDGVLQVSAALKGHPKNR